MTSNHLYFMEKRKSRGLKIIWKGSDVFLAKSGCKFQILFFKIMIHIKQIIFHGKKEIQRGEIIWNESDVFLAKSGCKFQSQGPMGPPPADSQSNHVCKLSNWKIQTINQMFKTFERREKRENLPISWPTSSPGVQWTTYCGTPLKQWSSPQP